MSIYGQCDGCDNPSTDVFCKDCRDDEAPSRVREWTEREKALGRLSPTEVALMERCIEDLE